MTNTAVLAPTTAYVRVELQDDTLWDLVKYLAWYYPARVRWCLGRPVYKH